MEAIRLMLQFMGARSTGKSSKEKGNGRREDLTLIVKLKQS